MWIAPTGDLTSASLHALIVRTTREAAIRAQELSHAIPRDQVDLEVLDRFLMSDRSPPDCCPISTVF